MPLLFLGYAIAYVDRINISLAALRMTEDLPGFNNEVIGFGGIFFIGYFILEIPGTLLVEKWSARKWIFRIMVTWGIVAALTAFVKTPVQFYAVRFALGLAEAGFFPGVIVYLTHWFPARDRGRALSWFFIATPVAQFVSPKLSYFLLRIGTTETAGGVTVHHPPLWGMQGWQWMYIAWGIPAVILGILVLFKLPDWPKDAPWLEPDERDALEQELKREKEQHKKGRGHMSVLDALQHPKVLLLAAAYFFVVSTSYGVETFLPKILERWYELNLSDLTWALMIPPLGGLFGQLLVGWSSDRTGERRLHGSIPIYIGAAALAGALVIPASFSFNCAAGHGRGAVHDGAHGAEVVHAGVLGPTQPALDGGGRRGEHRPDQFIGQPGGIRRPVPARDDRDQDRLVRVRPALPVRLDGHLGHDHLNPGTGPSRRQGFGRGDGACAPSVRRRNRLARRAGLSEGLPPDRDPCGQTQFIPYSRFHPCV